MDILISLEIILYKSYECYPIESPPIIFPTKKEAKERPAHCVIVPIVCITHAIKTNFFLPTLSPIGPDSFKVKIRHLYHLKNSEIYAYD